ncbi:SCO1860 family LAETG-anchored protein [Streptomyces sp. GC420]|uniref:SCO1860 family LAETG-anchored protein n=1 Tax=Streptomyces sp. GC420 TaxID=2697568 RepID=UPI001414F4B7|nr:SCO1860 family LAETG-anchored protein [Streptomyces sp. GC420]NBM16345.1 hypothetical protein [Streptomyces sp. GC420]
MSVLVRSTAALLSVGTALVTAVPAHATDEKGGGNASAVVLRTGLDVSLLDKSVRIPLRASLNEVRAPEAAADKTALAVTVDGVDKGRPVQILRADVATARADVTEGRAEAESNLVKARVHVPGLPLLSLIEVEKVTSKAVCEAGRQPVAESNLLGSVTALGKKVTLSTGGTTRVAVPGVGEVRLDLSREETTSTTAAATALELKVSVDPLELNVAEVEGTVTLAQATCTSPSSPASGPGSGSGNEAAPETETAAEPEGEAAEEASGDTPGIAAQSAGEPGRANLAETGGSSLTPYLAGGAFALVASGAGAVALARSRRRG